jgi:hypothetical protein
MKQKLFIIFCLTFIFICCISINIKAIEYDIAQQFTPILYFEKDEECFPVDAGDQINNSYLKQLDNNQILQTKKNIGNIII